MLVLDRESSLPPHSELVEVESQIVKLIDRVRVSLDLDGRCFQEFERETLYPFLKLLIKKFLSYSILKKLEEIANQCEMVITAQKISSSLNLLEKKLFKNNKLHEKKEASEEIDIEEEMRKKFGFDSKAHQSKPVQMVTSESKAKLFTRNRKDANVLVPKKQSKPEPAQKAETFHKNRSSLFYNKFIRKKGPSDSRPSMAHRGHMATSKKILANPKPMVKSPFFGSSPRNPSENDIPDFFKLNKMISKNSTKVIDLNEKKYDKRLENYRREQLKNRKLPNLKKSKPNRRRLTTSFKYTRVLRDKKGVGDLNDENIINLRSRADILNQFEQEMLKDFNQGELKRSFSFNEEPPKKPNQIIGVVSENDAALFNNLEKESSKESFSKLEPKFKNFKMEEKSEKNNLLENTGTSTKLDYPTKLFLPEDAEGQEDHDKENGLLYDPKPDSTLEKFKAKEEEIAFEIGSDDWDNNIFGKHTPTKDFL